MDDVAIDEHISFDDMIIVLNECKDENIEVLRRLKNHMKNCDYCKKNYYKLRRLQYALNLYADDVN